MVAGTVLITGASAGIGAACVRRFAGLGYHIIGVARRTTRLFALSEEFEGRFTGVELDLRDLKKIENRLNPVIQKRGSIDILINCAGLALGVGTADAADWADWEEMVATNITGLLAVTHTVLPYMRDRNAGHVINLGSIAGHFPYKGGNVYGATKAFVQQFSRNLRADLAGTPIRVSEIQPGMVGSTEFFATRFKGDLAKANSASATITPLSPDDVADAIAWVSQRPSHLNVDTLELLPVEQFAAGIALTPLMQMKTREGFPKPGFDLL